MDYNEAMQWLQVPRLLFIFVSMTASLAAPAIGADAASNAGGELWVYVGTYTKPAGAKSTAEGINFFRFDPATGRATQPTVVAKMQNPSSLRGIPHCR